MCGKFQFDHSNKWYMHNPATVLENYSHKLLWDFNIQTDHLIPTRWPDLIIINKQKENLQNCWLCCPGGPQDKSEGMWKYKRIILSGSDNLSESKQQKKKRTSRIVDFAVLPAHSRWRGSYPCAEKQPLYSTAPADWAITLQASLNIYIYTMCTR